MKKIAFIEANNNSKNNNFDEFMEPLGLCYVASTITKKSYDIKIFQQLNESDREFIDKIIKYSPDIVCYTSYTWNYNKTKKIADLIKNFTNCINIIGGIHATTSPMGCIEDFDYVVRGEGEKILPRLIDNLFSKNEVSEKGICFKKNGESHITGLAPRIKDLDSLNFPIRGDLPMEKYTGKGLSPLPPKTSHFASLITSRGCIGKCSFCVNRNLWRNKIFFRSPQNVCDEIKLLKHKYNTDYIWFGDENFCISKKRVCSMCQAFIKNGLRIKWACQSRADILDKELLNLMKKAGCSQLEFGIESGDLRILNNLNKKIDLCNIKQVIKTSFDIGIIPTAFFMLGSPFETIKSIKKTVNYAKKLYAIRYRFSVFYPFEGTPLRKIVDKFNLWKSEQHKFLDLANTNSFVVDSKDDLEHIDIRKILKEIYQSQFYKNKINCFVSKNPCYKNSMNDWNKYLKRYYEQTNPMF